MTEDARAQARRTRDYKALDLDDLEPHMRPAWAKGVLLHAAELQYLDGLTGSEAICAAVRSTPEYDSNGSAALAVWVLTGRPMSAGTLAVHMAHAREKGFVMPERPEVRLGEGHENASTLRSEDAAPLVVVDPGAVQALNDGLALLFEELTYPGSQDIGIEHGSLATAAAEMFSVMVAIAYCGLGDAYRPWLAALASAMAVDAGWHPFGERAYMEALRRARKRKGVDASDPAWQVLVHMKELPEPDIVLRSRKPLSKPFLRSFSIGSPPVLRRFRDRSGKHPSNNSTFGKRGRFPTKVKLPKKSTS